jgi:hypothetical protein
MYAIPVLASSPLNFWQLLQDHYLVAFDCTKLGSFDGRIKEKSLKLGLLVSLPSWRQVKTNVDV